MTGPPAHPSRARRCESKTSPQRDDMVTVSDGQVNPPTSLGIKMLLPARGDSPISGLFTNDHDPFTTFHGPKCCPTSAPTRPLTAPVALAEVSTFRMAVATECLSGITMALPCLTAVHTDIRHLTMAHRMGLYPWSSCPRDATIVVIANTAPEVFIRTDS
ncbi:uncharacterized protein ARMOST_03545 [Armillaria ostoyae]|uniref:Uncharacterized protein n=1 Tax=Armillaria ostoyae TaxID=47428 RepID=A0A284QUY1_ARMOS|nr:uncharacterized protein ARMOST_03545 [Armillaria ostoyae]